MTLSESSEEFEVFNQPPSLEDISADLDSQQQGDITTSDEMGIQRKNQRSLMDMIESQPERDAPGKSAQPKLPPPPPKSPLPPPQPPVPHRPDPADPKKKRESRKEKRQQKLGDLVLLKKMRPRELQSNKRLPKPCREGQRGGVISLQKLRLGFQPPCSMVNS